MCLGEAGRAALFQEAVKLLYLLRTHNAFPAGDATARDDFELQVLAMRVLLTPLPACTSGAEAARTSASAVNTHLFACREACLQLLMVVTSPDPERFELALARLAAEAGEASAAVLLAYPHSGPLPAHHASAPAPAANTRTTRVPRLLVPFLQALLGVLELQLLQAACSLRGGLGALVATTSGAKLIPVLVGSCSSDVHAVWCTASDC
jgi:hypothetical protein